MGASPETCDRSARFRIERVSDRQIVISDIGHAEGRRSVTNDAADVVAKLRRQCLLPDGRRLYYFDSDGSFDEIVVRDGKFVEFRFLSKADQTAITYDPVRAKPDDPVRGEHAHGR